MSVKGRSEQMTWLTLSYLTPQGPPVIWQLALLAPKADWTDPLNQSNSPPLAA